MNFTISIPDAALAAVTDFIAGKEKYGGDVANFPQIVINEAVENILQVWVPQAEKDLQAQLDSIRDARIEQTKAALAALLQ